MMGQISSKFTKIKVIFAINQMLYSHADNRYRLLMYFVKQSSF